MQSFRIPFRAMGSACEIVLAHDDAQMAAAWAKAGIDEVLRIEVKYSRYIKDSVVGLINARAGGLALECDDETWSLLQYAEALYRNSSGLFDITSGVLRRAWNFTTARVPTLDELHALGPLIGWDKVHLHGQTVRLTEPGMEIDFGGFGKEYAADRAWAAMHALGALYGYVNLAGDMRFLGPKPDGAPWNIGIQHPRNPGQLVATIPMSSGGLATSGDYEKYFERDGHRFCHILHPRTGMPVTHWRTVSVVAPLAVVAGSASTIAMLQGTAALTYLRTSALHFLAVDQDGKLHTHTDPHGPTPTLPSET